MLPCKNDSRKKYKGDEPSPKGMGHCAHAEKVGTQKKGRDGRRWTVREDKNGTKTWKPVTGTAPAEKKKAAYSPEKYAYLDNGEWFLEYYKKVKLPTAHATFLKALEAAWQDDAADKPTGLLAALFATESVREPPSLPRAASGAFAAYVSAKAKTSLGPIVVEENNINIGDPYYPKARQSFPAPNGEWTVMTWPATTAMIACAPGISRTSIQKLGSWKLLSCHGRSFQGVSDRVFTADQVEEMLDSTGEHVRGRHIVAEVAHEMRGRVAMLGFKGTKVACVLYPSMLNNL